MYFRLPNVFVAKYMDTVEPAEQESSAVPQFHLPVSLLEEPQDFEGKVILAQKVIRWALDMCPGGVVMSTSFGMQSAIMLHLIAEIDKTIPVIWIDTGYLPPETYHYAAQLKALFDLNVHIFQSEISPAHMEAIHGRLWEKSEPNAHRLYGLLRKVMPMRKAQRELGASLMLAGVRRSQTSHRKSMSLYTAAESESECGKVSPILSFSDEDAVRYFSTYSLPQHPLVAKGYTSVGDAHSSRPRLAGDKDDRSTRFGNQKGQQECGLHTETGTLEEYDKIISKAMRRSATDEEPDNVLPVHTLPAGYLVFGRVKCKYCRATKALLESKGLAFTEYLVVKPGEREGETEGRGKDVIPLGQLVQLVREVREEPDMVVNTVPQVFLDREHVGGFSELCPSLGVDGEEAAELVRRAAENPDGAGATVSSAQDSTGTGEPTSNSISANPVPMAGCQAGLPTEMMAEFWGAHTHTQAALQ